MRDVVASVGLACLLNGVIFALGWGPTEGRVEPWFAPPGWAIGAAWVVLFACMGAARYLVRRSGKPNADRDKWLVTGLIVFCAVYPVYTRGLSDLRIGLVGNFVTLVAVVLVTAIIRRTSRSASMLFVPVFGWVFFATLLIARLYSLNS